MRITGGYVGELKTHYLSWEFLVGVCHLGLQILILFHTKKCDFPPWILDLASAENIIIIIT